MKVNEDHTWPVAWPCCAPVLGSAMLVDACSIFLKPWCLVTQQHASRIASPWSHLLPPWVEAIAWLHDEQCSSEVQHAANPPHGLAHGVALLIVDQGSCAGMKLLQLARKELCLASVLLQRHLCRLVASTSST